MASVSALTGRLIDRTDDIAQSVLTLLSTPIGSRVHRRDYGCALFDLIDSPANPTGILQIIAACADAIARWERRAVLNGGSVLVAIDGQTLIDLDLTDRTTGAAIRLSVPLLTALPAEDAT